MKNNGRVEVSGLNQDHSPDVIFINSPLRDYGPKPRIDQEVLPALGIAYILTHLGEKGNNVGHLDAEHQGTPIAKIVETVNSLQPRYVGMNVLTPTLEMVLKTAANLDPELKLILGGPHATAMPEKTLKKIVAVHPNTILIKGEAEVAVQQILDGVGVHNVGETYWVENGVVRVSNAMPIILAPDQLPIINRKYLPNDPSLDKRKGRIEARVMTARNCPFNCTFCAGARATTHMPTRNRPPQHVLEEISGLVLGQGVQDIRFVDDLAISSEKRIRTLFNLFQEHNLPIFAWDATGRANILAKMHPETFKYMKEIGMYECAIGIESGSDRIRKLMNKEITENEIFESIKKLVEAGIKVKGYFMIGLRSETAEETRQTIDLANRLVQTYKGMFRASMFVFRPYPGTQEWDSLIEEGWTEDELLEMTTDFGTDHRAKHMVVTHHQFGELNPYSLAQMVEEFNAWQESQL